MFKNEKWRLSTLRIFEWDLYYYCTLLSKRQDNKIQNW